MLTSCHGKRNCYKIPLPVSSRPGDSSPYKRDYCCFRSFIRHRSVTCSKWNIFSSKSTLQMYCCFLITRLRSLGPLRSIYSPLQSPTRFYAYGIYITLQTPFLLSDADSTLFLPVGLDDLVHFIDLAVQAACGDKSRELPREERVH